jgi:HEAT repeat protein
MNTRRVNPLLRLLFLAVLVLMPTACRQDKSPSGQTQSPPPSGKVQSPDDAKHTANNAAVQSKGPAVAEVVSPVALQAEEGDLVGAVAAYRKQYDPATLQGLVALRQLAIQALRLGMRIGDPHERNVIAAVLGRLGDPAALWVLDEAIHSTEPMLRRSAADALGDLATPGAVCLLRRLYESDMESKRLALSGLRRTGDKTAVLCYLDAISSSDTALRAQGIGGLGEARTLTERPALRKFLKTEKDPLIGLTVAYSLAAVGDKEGFAHLKAKLADRQEQMRDSVVGLLGSIDDPAVVPLLQAALQSDPSVTVRTTAAASLVHFKDVSGMSLLEQALMDADFRVRLGVAMALSRMDYPTAKPLVIKALASEDPLVRTNALKVVGDHEDTSVTSLVLEAVGRENDRYVKSQALWTLGKIGDVKTIPAVLDLLAEDREEIRHSAAEALVLLSDRLLADGKREKR